MVTLCYRLNCLDISSKNVLIEWRCGSTWGQLSLSVWTNWVWVRSQTEDNMVMPLVIQINIRDSARNRKLRWTFLKTRSLNWDIDICYLDMYHKTLRVLKIFMFDCLSETPRWREILSWRHTERDCSLPRHYLNDNLLWEVLSQDDHPGGDWSEVTAPESRH